MKTAWLFVGVAIKIPQYAHYENSLLENSHLTSQGGLNAVFKCDLFARAG